MAAVSQRPKVYLVGLGLLVFCTVLYGVSIFAPGWITYQESDTTTVSKSMWERDLVLCLDMTNGTSTCRRIYPSKAWLLFGQIQEVIGFGILFMASAFALFINFARQTIVTTYVSEGLAMTSFMVGCFGQMTCTAEVHMALNITFSWAYVFNTLAYSLSYFAAILMALNNDPPRPL